MVEKMNCPECGAVDDLCKSRFEEFLVLEFTDPGYGAVHHLTVTAYMLQHSSHLTREGWLYERDLLKEFIIDNKPPALVQEQRRHLLDSGKRTFKVKSKDGQPVIRKSTWTRTILDVRMEDSKSYCEDVIAWASLVLDEIGSESI
jgi:hypothetical protein